MASGAYIDNDASLSVVVVSDRGLAIVVVGVVAGDSMETAEATPHRFLNATRPPTRTTRTCGPGARRRYVTPRRHGRREPRSSWQVVIRRVRRQTKRAVDDAPVSGGTAMICSRAPPTASRAGAAAACAGHVAARTAQVSIEMMAATRRAPSRGARRPQRDCNM